MNLFPRTGSVALPFSLLFAAFAGVWIFLSHWGLRAINPEPGTIARFGIYTDFAFMAATAFLFYGALRRKYHRLEKEFAARRQAMDTLAEHDFHLNSVQRLVPDGFWVVDREGRFLEVNAAYCAMSGFTREELLRMCLADVEAHETEAEIATRIAQIARDGRVQFETQHWHKDGRVIDVEVGVAYASLDGGRCVGFCRDITERKRVEAALRDSEQKYRLLVDHASEAIYVLQHGVIRFANRACAEFSGVSQSALVGRSILDFVPPEDRPWVKQHNERLVGGDTEADHGEFRLRTAQGKVLWFAVSTVRIAWQGSPATLSLATNITERKRVEEQLQTLSRAVEQSPVSIVITNPAGEIEYVNPKFCQLTGYTPDEARGKNPRILNSGELAPEVYRNLWQTITQGREWRGEFHNKKKNGELYWEYASLSPILDAAGRTTHFLAVKEDITARKQAEAERERLEAELREAHKMEAVGTLAGGIAHDFNNILGAILGNAQLAAPELEAGHPARQCLDEIVKASRRGRDLVNRILTFSRGQRMCRQPTTLHPVVTECLRLLRATLPANVELVLSLAPDTPPVLADPPQIHQVVVNLATNAWHALEDRPGRIEIGLQSVTVTPPVNGENADLPPGGYACLSVTDNGIGMNAATVKRIFDPFFTTKAPGEGTGLGLAIVAGIVRDHDGKIRVKSAPQRGTTVQIFLPAVGADPAGAVESPSPDAPVVPHGQGRRVLYLDDEAPLVQVTPRLLGRLGYQAVGFNRAADALAAFRAAPDHFQLAIVDFNMPGRNGLQAAAELLAERPELPVVLCSGFLTQEIEAEGRRLGVRGWLSKPTTIEELGGTLARLLVTPDNL